MKHLTFCRQLRCAKQNSEKTSIRACTGSETLEECCFVGIALPVFVKAEFQNWENQRGDKSQNDHMTRISRCLRNSLYQKITTVFSANLKHFKLLHTVLFSTPMKLRFTKIHNTKPSNTISLLLSCMSNSFTRINCDKLCTNGRK